jgi:hypothetical protein
MQQLAVLGGEAKHDLVHPDAEVRIRSASDSAQFLAIGASCDRCGPVESCSECRHDGP